MGSAERICPIVQDGGLYYHCRTKGFAFATEAESRGEKRGCGGHAPWPGWRRLAWSCRPRGDQHISAAAAAIAAGV
jgi:hypothetical protein